MCNTLDRIKHKSENGAHLSQAMARMLMQLPTNPARETTVVTVQDIFQSSKVSEDLEEDKQLLMNDKNNHWWMFRTNTNNKTQHEWMNDHNNC